MRKNRATLIVAAALGLPTKRCGNQVQAASDAGILPKAAGGARLDLSPKQLANLFLAIIADRGVAQTPRSVETFGSLADANGNTLGQTLEAMFAGRIAVSDTDDLLLSLQPGTESASLAARRFGSTLPSSAAARVVAIPASALRSITASFHGKPFSAWPHALHANAIPAHALSRR